MAYHNYKVAGSIYISKGGNDVVPGSDSNAPRKGLQNAASAVYVVGAGVYLSAAIGTSNPANSYIGDGKVVIIGSSIGERGIYNNITLVNMSLAGLGNTNANESTTDTTFINLTGAPSSGNAGTRTHTRGRFIGCTYNPIGGVLSLPYGIIINSQITGTASKSIQNAYIDRDSAIVGFTNPANFRNNNVEGVISLGGISYAIQDQYTGTPQDNGYPTGVKWLTEAQLTTDGYGGTISGWNTAVATCMNRDPKFVDVSALNFSLQSDSPHIRAALDGINNIGFTDVGILIENTDDGIGGVSVIASAQIDTTIAEAYILDSGQTEGYVDYVFPTGGKTIKRLNVNAAYNFNSDIAGGDPQNSNVPDAHPLTSSYAGKTTTTGAPGVLNQIIIAENLVSVGDHIKVNGQPRSVTSISNSGGNDTLTLSSNLIANIGSGVTVTYGTEAQIAALNPNRLTVLMRTRSTASAPTIPLTDSEWDNEVDPGYGVVGTLFHQEIGVKPGLIISGSNVWGAGDSDAPTGITPQELAPQWCHIRVYLRDNYSSNGL